jgi:hypothetical protein
MQELGENLLIPGFCARGFVALVDSELPCTVFVMLYA